MQLYTSNKPELKNQKNLTSHDWKPFMDMNSEIGADKIALIMGLDGGEN